MVDIQHVGTAESSDTTGLCRRDGIATCNKNQSRVQLEEPIGRVIKSLGIKETKRKREK